MSACIVRCPTPPPDLSPTLRVTDGVPTSHPIGRDPGLPGPRADVPTGRPTSVASVSSTAPSSEVRRSAKWEVRREAIIDTSARLFARSGYHATGIAELCEANDLGKGALYHYIGSKEELLAAIHDRVMDEVMLGADRVAQAGGSPPTQLARLGEELLDVIHRYPDHVWVFLHEFPALTGDNGERFRRRRREYEQRIER